jgi:pimeloyl-ACP methyl ester carboxylesterase
MVLAVDVAPAPGSAEEPAGDWIGHLPSGFKVRLHVTKTADRYAGALINASGAATPFDQLASDGARLHFGVSKLGLGYDGVWDEEHKVWRGDLTFQGRYPLSLQRASPESLAPKVRKRPQEDAIAAGPRPYVEQDVTFENLAAKINLAGTLSLPEGQGPFPAVVLVSGTGRNTREEDVAGHKVFTVLADALNRKGVAVLRYDKRGVGASSGGFQGATTADFATDASAAVDFLRTRPGIDPARVGLLGHSEGGVIAPLVGATNGAVAFVVMMAAPAIRGDKLFIAQSVATARLYGAPETYIVKRRAFDQTLYDAIIAAQSPEAAQMRARALIARGVEEKIVDANEADTLLTDTTSAWERYFLAHDPGPTLRNLTVPVLAVYGALDAQVPASENAPAAREALKGDKDATIVELPGLNHLLQQAQTGSPQEYGEIDETVSPRGLQVIVDWVSTDHRRSGPKAEAPPTF